MEGSGGGQQNQMSRCGWRAAGGLAKAEAEEGEEVKEVECTFRRCCAALARLAALYDSVRARAMRRHRTGRSRRELHAEGEGDDHARRVACD